MTDSSSQLPRLSVVMPTHNGERWLRQTLDSLVAQPDRDFECIVIDSSATEGTLDLIGRYADRLDIRIHTRRDLGNWPVKTNFGFEVARAPFVCMLHQDDYWMPGRTPLLRKWLDATPGAVMHFHPSFIVDGNGRRLGTWRCPLPADHRPAPTTMVLERLLVQNFIAIPAPVIRRDAFLAVGGLDESLWYTGDWDLYLKLIRHGHVVYHPEPLTCFRIHGQSLTVSGSRSIEEFERQLRTVLEAHATALPEARRNAVLPKALASVTVNTALAAANHGSYLSALRALSAVLRLGPIAGVEYLRDSRLIERVVPRLRARLAGAF